MNEAGERAFTERVAAAKLKISPPLKKRALTAHNLLLIRRFGEKYCVDKEEPNIYIQLLAQLAIDGIVEIKRIRNYLIVSDYYEKLVESGNFSIQVINELSREYHMSSRQIQNIIYKWAKRERKSNT